MTLFGDRVTVDVRMRSDWSRLGPYSNVTDVVRKRGNLVTDKYRKKSVNTQGAHHVKMKAEVGMMLLQANDLQRWPANHQKVGERWGRDASTLPSAGTNPADT